MLSTCRYLHVYLLFTVWFLVQLIRANLPIPVTEFQRRFIQSLCCLVVFVVFIYVSGFRYVVWVANICIYMQYNNIVCTHNCLFYQTLVLYDQLFKLHNLITWACLNKLFQNSWSRLLLSSTV